MADSWVDQSARTKNYGTGTNLRVDNSPVRKAYLRFNVEGLTSAVKQATLRLYATTAPSVGYDVRALADNTWGERTITWNNAPPPSQTVTGSSGPFSSPQWTSVDVTALVGGNGPVSFALTTPSSTSTHMASREYGPTRTPQLVVTTVGVPPSVTSPPTISGGARQGSTLTAAPGSWAGTEPITYGYQWQRCDTEGGCSDIPGAVGKTYTLGSADVGSSVRVTVTASNEAGSSTETSTATAVVEPAPAPTPPTNGTRPTISGAARQGSTLTADLGTWTGTEPMTHSYQWRRCESAATNCTDIAGAAGRTYTLGSAEVGFTIEVAVTASNDAGSSTAISEATAVVTATDPVVVAAGDIACDPASSSFNGGLGSTSSCHQKATSDLIGGAGLAAVLPLGDLQYENAGLAEFQQSYEASWGRVKEITRPVPGNHEYHTTAASGYFDYFNGAGNASGPAGDRSTGYYSFDVGAWHLIALNSNCSRVGGCGAGSAQEQWLRQDLAASGADCTLAYWHHPLFSSGTNSPGISSTRPLFQALYDHGADVVLVGHDHNYERFARQDPNGTLDPARGLRQFLVGTGGKSHYAQGAPVPNSEVRSSDTYGILELTLHASGYEWRFVPESGKTFTDSGSDSCNGAAADGEAPTAPGDLTARAPGSNIVELSWTAAGDNVGVTGYEIYRNGTLLATTASAVTSYTDSTVAGATAYEYHVKARDAAHNVSAPSNTATVTTPAGSTALAFSAEADARVQEASPSTNHGASYLRTDGGSDPDVESYLRFNVSGISGAVKSAKLRLHAYTGTADGPAVFGTASSWAETGITWGSRPAPLGEATDDKSAIGANTWVEYDVTPLVQANGTYSFRLATTSSDGVDIYSREASFRPELMVTFG